MIFKSNNIYLWLGSTQNQLKANSTNVKIKFSRFCKLHSLNNGYIIDNNTSFYMFIDS